MAETGIRSDRRLAATDQFTPIFAMSRVAGWAAHVLEQHGNNRLIRPRSEYTGATDARYVPISER